MRAPRWAGLLVLTAVLTATPAPADAAAGPGVVVQAVRSSSDLVSLVAEVRPLPVPPLRASAIGVTSGGTQLATRVTPLLSARNAVTMVVDASAAGGPYLEQGGQSGVAGFLLQLPTDSPTALIADRTPPSVISRASVGVTDDLSAASAIRSSGARATSAALTLAVKQAPGGSVVALYTSAPNAGGEPADALAARLQRAGAVLVVVNTGRSSRYWAKVATATGGLAIKTRPSQAIHAFDRIADSLRSRYLVAFARPAGRAATVRVRTAQGTVSASVTVPPVTAAPLRVAAQAPAEAREPAGENGVRQWLWLMFAALACVTVAFVALGRRRPSTPVDEPENPPVVDLPGVRVYEAADLFEPRAARDAREAREPDDARPAPNDSDARAPEPSAPEPKKFFDVPQGPRFPTPP
jgi:hypothetical protein